MPNAKDNVATAKQALVDARAELAHMKSERIETDGRCAAHEVQKKASKANAKKYAEAANKLRDAQTELERIDELIADAEEAVRLAEKGVTSAELERDSSAMDVIAAKLAEQKTQLALAIAAYAAARAQFAGTFFEGKSRLERLRRECEKAGAPFEDRACFSDSGLERELLHAAPKFTSVAGLRETDVVTAIVEQTRQALGHRAPAAGINYSAASQFDDMMAGTYVARLSAIEAGTV